MALAITAAAQCGGGPPHAGPGALVAGGGLGSQRQALLWSPILLCSRPKEALLRPEKQQQLDEELRGSLRFAGSETLAATRFEFGRRASQRIFASTWGLDSVSDGSVFIYWAKPKPLP